MDPDEVMNLISPEREAELLEKEERLEEFEQLVKYLRLEVFSYRAKWQVNDPPRRDAVLRTLNRWYKRIVDLEPKTLFEYYERGGL